MRLQDKQTRRTIGVRKKARTVAYSINTTEYHGCQDQAGATVASTSGFMDIRVTSAVPHVVNTCTSEYKYSSTATTANPGPEAHDPESKDMELGTVETGESASSMPTYDTQQNESHRWWKGPSCPGM